MPPSLPELDPVIHGQVRLAALSLLMGADDAEFTYLRDTIGTTDGNLSVHLSKLSDAGYIAVKKQFIDRKPKTFYRMTERGRTAFSKYLKDLKALLGAGVV